MTCYRPLQGYRSPSGKIQVAPSRDNEGFVALNCGSCIGCLLERAQGWAIRAVHEQQVSGNGAFVTLTYRNIDLPQGKSLRSEHFRLWLKRARAKFGPFRYLACGEYGPKDKRPHYHVCMFGIEFDDLVKWKKTPAGSTIFRSEKLEETWPYGYSSVGQLTAQSAGYTARYTLKKLDSGVYKDYGEREPEFIRVSRRPGLGAEWFRKYWRDVYPLDQVVTKEGKEFKPPRYYDKLLAVSCILANLSSSPNVHPSLYAKIKDDREMKAREQMKKLADLRRPWKRNDHREENKRDKVERLKRQIEDTEYDL